MLWRAQPSDTSVAKALVADHGACRACRLWFSHVYRDVRGGIPGRLTTTHDHSSVCTQGTIRARMQTRKDQPQTMLELMVRMYEHEVRAVLPLQ